MLALTPKDQYHFKNKRIFELDEWLVVTGKYNMHLQRIYNLHLFLSFDKSPYCVPTCPACKKHALYMYDGIIICMFCKSVVDYIGDIKCSNSNEWNSNKVGIKWETI